jgi:glycosyltransferase-like protein LARGE
LAPFYDERFHGYGKNKISYLQHIRFLGYKFFVLPQGFIVHNPHVDSKAKEVWNDVDASELHEEMDQLYPKFLKELVARYKQNADRIVQPCPKSEAKDKR